jgi:integrase
MHAQQIRCRQGRSGPQLKDARDRLDADSPPTDATRSVGDWLSHWRATTLAASDRKPATRELYAALCRKHLESGAIASLSVARLRPSDIEALLLTLRDKKLSESTIRSVYTVLRLALDGAVRDGLLGRNPAAAVARPTVQSGRPGTWQLPT